MKPVKPEITYVEEEKVMCDGRDSLVDHPLIYLDITEEEGSITCPYCSRHFMLKAGKKKVGSGH